jgi:hypothetical protein
MGYSASVSPADLFTSIMRITAPLFLLLAAGVTAAPAKKPPGKPVPKAPAAKKAAAKPGGAGAAASRPPGAQRPAPKTQSVPAGLSGAVQAGAAAALTGASQVPDARMGGAASGRETVFQTNSAYDARIDLRTDLVAVHKHGAAWEEIDQAIKSWKGAGYPVHRMFFIGSDAGGVYTGGGADGMPHADEVETDAEGAPIKLGERPYMVPTPGWLAYLKEHIRRGIESGADGVWPEEPLMHAAGGYSPAFKRAWQEFYQSPWQDPRESPRAFFRASALKADLYLRAVNELLRSTKEEAQKAGREVQFLLPVHSPIGYANSRLIFPHAAASRLPVDGVVAQVWSGPARFPVTVEGKTEPRLFESSWMMYSYFANLMEGMKGKALYFLADPVEDDPGFSWPEYERWYKATLAASLLFPQASGYQVMPWPERVYLPGHVNSGRPPAPPAYLTQLADIAAALKEIPSSGPLEWTGGTRGLGVLTLDTMMWQRGGPQGSSMRSLHGLVMPLLTRGVPVEIVPGERAADPVYLSRFKVLLLSYDMQKPQGPELHAALAEWVRAGGVLVVVGGEDAYNDIGEWWSRNGFPGPTEHLFRQCGAGVNVHERTVHRPDAAFKEVLKAEGRTRSAENEKLYPVSLAALQAVGKPVYLRFTDLHPEDGWGPRLGRVRVVDGGRVRADFTAGSVAERPFLLEDIGSIVDKGRRFADGDASWVYRFTGLGPEARLELELSNQFRVQVAVGADPGTVLQPLPGAVLGAARVPSVRPVVSYELDGAEPLYRIGSDAASAPAWVSNSGAGAVIYCGAAAAVGADTAAGAEMLRALVRHACTRASIPYVEGPMVFRRGPYVIAHSLGRPMPLKGTYLDLFHPDLRLVENPRLPYREPAFYKEVRLTRVPALLHASHRARVLEASPARLRLTLEGPDGTWGTLRVFPAGMSLGSADASDHRGQPVSLDVRPEGKTLLVRYPQRAAGLNLQLRWVRPEARLTK